MQRHMGSGGNWSVNTSVDRWRRIRAVWWRRWEPPPSDNLKGFPNVMSGRSNTQRGWVFQRVNDTPWLTRICGFLTVSSDVQFYPQQSLVGSSTKTQKRRCHRWRRSTRSTRMLARKQWTSTVRWSRRPSESPIRWRWSSMPCRKQTMRQKGRGCASSYLGEGQRKVEEENYKVLGELRMALCASMAASCSLSCGTGDRIYNANNYLDVALAIFRSVDADDDAFEECGHVGWVETKIVAVMEEMAMKVEIKTERWCRKFEQFGEFEWHGPLRRRWMVFCALRVGW